MNFRKFLFVVLMCNSFLAFAQSDSLIQIYPGLGDRLTSFDRTYLGLFLEVQEFNSAVFYVRNGDKLVTKLYASTNDTIKESIKVQKLSSLDSLRSIIKKVDVINTELLLNERHNFSLFTNEGNFIQGELEMFDENYIYVTAENIKADHLGRMKYRIPVSNISEFNLEGSSNVLLGICIGGAVGAALGLVASKLISNSGKEETESLSNCASSFGAGIAGAATGAAIALGGVIIGTIVGIGTSSDDMVFYFNTDMDVLRLRNHCGYVLDKEILNEQKYYDAH